MAVAGAKQDQNQEEGSGADVSVDAGVADRNAELVESVSDRQEYSEVAEPSTDLSLERAEKKVASQAAFSRSRLRSRTS